MREYITQNGDVLDLVCIQMDGNDHALNEVMDLNHWLADHDFQSLPEGLVIVFPDLVSQETVKEEIALWS